MFFNASNGVEVECPAPGWQVLAQWLAGLNFELFLKTMSKERIRGKGGHTNKFD